MEVATEWTGLQRALAACGVIVGTAACFKIWKLLSYKDEERDIIGTFQKPWRQCASLETSLELLHSMANGQLLDANVIILESQQRVRVDDIKRALGMLMERYQTLRLRFRYGSRETVKYFVEMDENVVDFLEVDTTDWVHVLEKELKVLFDSSKGPLWRVRMLKGQEKDGTHRVPLVFTFHHALLDGISIMKVYTEFMTFMNSTKNEDSQSSIECIPMSLPLETYLGTKPWGYITTKAASLLLVILLKAGFRPGKTPEMLRKFLAEQKPVETEKTTSVLSIAFSAEETRKILSTSKKNGVTVHGSCTTAASLALRRLLLNHGAIKDGDTINLPTGFNTSLRRYAKVPIPNETLGVFISFSKLSITLGENPENLFWDIAKTCLSDIKKSLDGGSPLTVVKMNQVALQLLGDGHTKLMEVKEPFTAFNISNRGNFMFPASGRHERSDAKAAAANETQGADERYKVVETYWATAEHNGPFHLFVHNVVTINGRMSWSLVYYKHVVEMAIAEEYAGCIKGILMEKCDDA